MSMYGTDEHMARDYPIHHEIWQPYDPSHALGTDDMAWKLVQFLSWLEDEKGIRLGKYNDEGDELLDTVFIDDTLYEYLGDKESLAFEYFGYDYKEYMREKERMVVAMRRAQGFSDKGYHLESEEEREAQRRKVLEKGWRD